MTVASSVNLVSAIGNGVTTVFPFSFRIPEGTAIVTLLSLETEIEGDPLVEGVDYSISGEDNPNGGSVTYPLSGSPLASTHKINIKRVVDIEQPYDITSQSGYDPATLEEVLDRFAMVLGQHDEAIARSIKVYSGNALPQEGLGEEIGQIAADAAASAAAAAQSAEDAAEAVTGLVPSNNLSDLTSAATARENLGLEINVDVQAHSEDLNAFLALTPADDDVLQRKAGVWTNRTIAQLRADLGVSIVLLGTLTTTSGTTQSLTDIPQTYRSLQFLVRDVSSNGTGGLQMKVSDSNGLSYGAASSIGNTSQTASEKLQGLIEIFDYASAASFKLGRQETNSSAFNSSGQIAPTVGAINAVQFLWSAGNTFDGGEILVYGVK